MIFLGKEVFFADRFSATRYGAVFRFCMLFLFAVILMLSFSRYSSADSLNLRNIGQVGFNGTSDDYTSLTTVILDISGNDITNCSCNNFNGSDPSSYTWSYRSWSSWKSCSKSKYWFITPVLGSQDSVPVYVRCLVNHTNDSLSLVTDSIIYSPSGVGLDRTPASSFMIYPLSNYPGQYFFVDNSTEVFLNWSRASDPESDYLQIPLVYTYKVLHEYLNDTSGLRMNKTIINTTSVGTNNYVTISFFREMIDKNEIFRDDDGIYFVVSAWNSANLETRSVLSKKIKTNDPLVTSILSDTISESNWYSFSDLNLSLDEIYFLWNGTDNVSGIYCYNILLTKDSLAAPSEVCSGRVGNLDHFTDYLMTDIRSKLSDGKNYFSVRARSNAGKWGEPLKFSINIDNDPPTRPVLYLSSYVISGLSNASNSSNSSAANVSTTTKIIQDSRGLIFNWSASDSGCGITNHYVEVSNSVDFSDVLFSGYTNSSEQSFNFSAFNDGTYYLRVKAIDCMGHESSFSDVFESLKKNEHLAILSAGPEGDVCSDNPYLEVKTNRDAICTFMISSASAVVNNKYKNYSQFSYTNSTLHQSGVKLAPGEYSATVVCNDTPDVVSTTFSFNVLSDFYFSSAAISSDRKEISYGESAEIMLDISPKISRLTKDSVLFYERKIFPIKIDPSQYVLTDLGQGKYAIYFDMPKDKGSHTYFAELVRDGVFVDSNDLSFTVDDPRLYVSFEPNLESTAIGEKSVSNYDNIVFSKVQSLNLTFGIGALGSEVGLDSFGYDMNVPYMDDIMFFVTRYSFDFSKREDMLYYEGFRNLNNPSFGFYIDDTFDYKLISDAEDIVFSNDNPIDTGKKSVIVKNQGYDQDGRVKVFVSSSKIQNSTGTADAGVN